MHGVRLAVVNEECVAGRKKDVKALSISRRGSGNPVAAEFRAIGKGSKPGVGQSLGIIEPEAHGIGEVRVIIACELSLKHVAKQSRAEGLEWMDTRAMPFDGISVWTNPATDSPIAWHVNKPDKVNRMQVVVFFHIGVPMIFCETD